LSIRRPGIAVQSLSVHAPGSEGTIVDGERRDERSPSPTIAVVDLVRRVAAGRLVDHDLAALVETSRPLARDLVTRAGLGEFSKLVR
jgi:hypothetical protein